MYNFLLELNENFGNTVKNDFEDIGQGLNFNTGILNF